jgi:hypothetical protein
MKHMKHMKQKALLAFMTGVAVAGAFWAIPAEATGSGTRRIVSLGCHAFPAGDTCYVIIDGPSVGPAGCHNKSLRWASGTVAGKNALTQLTAAFLAGKQVSFEIPDTCFANEPAFPTFIWYDVHF